MDNVKLSISTILATILIAVTTTHAQAAAKRLAPSAFCHPEFEVTEFFGSTVNLVQRVGPQLRNSLGENTIICGFPSDPSLSHSNVNLIKIRGYRGTIGEFTDANVRACVGTFGGGERCGYSTFFADGSGSFTVEVDDLSEWANAHWYPYLKITLQVGDRLHGIVVTD